MFSFLKQKHGYHLQVHRTVILTNDSSYGLCNVPLLAGLYEQLLFFINKKKCGQRTQMGTG